MTNDVIGHPPVQTRKRRGRTSWALITLATLAIGALLYFGHEVFVPVALALLFSVVLSSAVEGLHRWFGGWFWGIAGIVIAVPSLVALKVAATHSDKAGALVQLLSPSENKPFDALKGRVTTVGAL